MAGFLEGMGGAAPLITWAFIVAVVLPRDWMVFGLWAPVVALSLWALYLAACLLCLWQHERPKRRKAGRWLNGVAL